MYIKTYLYSVLLVISQVALAKPTLVSKVIPQDTEVQVKVVKEERFDYTGQIKSCLVDLYIAQLRFFETNDKYTSSIADLKVGQSEACKGIEVSCEMANKENFRVAGKLKGELWTLDESKSMTQIQ